MLVKVLLLSHDASLLDLQGFCVLQFNLSALLENHVNDSVEVFINLYHDLDFALFDLLTQLGTLVN